MRLISYDIGIKNLAYCVIEYEDEQLSIIDWNVMNLLEETTALKKCSQINKIKGSQNQTCQCIKDAKFKKGDQYYCTKHAQKSGFIIPTKKHKKGFLKKMGNNEIHQLAKSIFLFENLEKTKKDEIVDKIMKYYEKQCLELVIEKKEKNAGEADLILIGKRMKKLLDENQITETITHVVIENQISPIATRMKTVQGMLTQYYIDNRKKWPNGIPFTEKKAIRCIPGCCGYSGPIVGFKILEDDILAKVYRRHRYKSAEGHY
jgi:hypothetical protein